MMPRRGGNTGRDGHHHLRKSTASHVHIVTLSIGHVVRELMIRSETTVEEVCACITSGFSHEQTAVAVRHTTQRVVYPLSLIVHSPQRFSDGIYEVMLGEVEVEVTTGSTCNTTSKQSLSKRKPWKSQQEQPIGMPEFIDLYDRLSPQLMEETEEEEEEEKMMRELDLTDFELPQLVQMFTNACSSNGKMSRTTFNQCINTLLSPEQSHYRMMFNRLFGIFDTESTNKVDLYLFLGGLSVFVSGERDEKIKCIFQVYDSDKDGFLTIQEMIQYLTAVFIVISKTSPELFQQQQVNPLELGRITAKECFKEAGIKEKDGLLSFQAFKEWYSIPTQLTMHPAVQNEHSSSQTLDSLASLIGLCDYKPTQVFELIASQVNEDGLLSYNAFQDIFKQFIPPPRTESEQNQIYSILHRIFTALDPHRTGFVDFCEISSGLSVFCKGTLEEKVKAAFTLFDLHQNGLISQQEMETYLASVYRMIMMISPSTTATISPDQLAQVTTEEAFKQLDRNQDGKLSFQEFTTWYTTPNFFTSSSSRHVLREMKQLTNLEAYDVQDIIEFFKNSADVHGNISKPAFFHCFRKLMAGKSGNIELEPRSRQLLVELFDVLDTDGNGLIDVMELSAGLSILCSGNKIQSLFLLYDRNQDGFISISEMEMYLTAIYKILYKRSPQLYLQTNKKPQELAKDTTLECFQSFDVNEDEQLSFKEFNEWIQSQSTSVLSVVLSDSIETTSQSSKETKLDVVPTFTGLKKPFTLEQVRSLTNLGQLEVMEVLERFANHTNEDGVLTKQAFEECFHDLMSSSLSSVEKKQAKVMIDRLFTVLDVNQNKTIDFNELASGLSVLCKGTREDKVQAVFRLYDYNGDGFISLEEMKRYLTSIFRILYEIQPQMQSETGVSAEELGTITAEQAFIEADTNQDGQLSLDEFVRWYTTSSPVGTTSGVIKKAVVETSLSFAEIKRLTNLSQYEPEQVFEVFAAEANEHGMLSKEAFMTSFSKILQSKDTQNKVTHILNGLFHVFDTDHSGFVDFSEVASGLSVLCGGKKEDKVRAAFRLFDFNGDGFISLQEMTTYLVSVFRVLYQLSPETQQLGVTPEELGQVTAEQAFAEADQNKDGRLTLEEFEAWYQQPNGLFSIAEASRWTTLQGCSPIQLLEALADCANHEGFVSKSAFDACFHKLLPPTVDTTILNRLFHVFDTQQQEKVDFSEISSGLLILCGGTVDDKVQAAFSLFDYNGDGFISLEEMERYLTSVFKVLHETTSNLQESAEILGKQTAQQAFEQADSDQDGKLSWNEFRQWYLQSNLQQLMENNIPEWLSIQEIRQWTNLKELSPTQVFDTLARFASTQGTLDKQAFQQAFTALSTNDSSSTNRLQWMIDRLFRLFDSDQSGTVDFSELASGLSILCGGKEMDKVRTAFQLYDVNQDGFISLKEMEMYLTSVFKVLYELNPETQERLGVTAEELGRITAEQAFEQADVDRDGRLSFEEFYQWYRPSETSNSVEHWMTLQVVKAMTHLERYTPNEVFTIFANHCSDDGTLSRPAFEACFEQLIDPSVYKKERVQWILDRLFTIFDSDGNGLVDFCELTSGLSVLCGGTRQDKVRAAFALYDLNHDGFISLEEMIRYLTSVFKVLYEINPETKRMLNVTPLELATVTAEQCFVEADVNHDGRLSFEEFVRWYTQTSPDDAVVPSNGQVESPSSPSSRPQWNLNSPSIQRARQLLKLDTYEVNDVFEIFAEAAPSGELSFANFKKCFDQLIKLAGGHDTKEEKEETEQLVRRLFRVFDTNQSNTVDFGELASGLSVLSGSSMDDKVQAAFQLYDLNGDGSISLDEMISYMTSIFKVMYETSENRKKTIKVPPEELAHVTAMQCFKEADINHDGKLSFAEFKKWCTSTV